MREEAAARFVLESAKKGFPKTRVFRMKKFKNQNRARRVDPARLTRMSVAFSRGASLYSWLCLHVC